MKNTLYFILFTCFVLSNFYSIAQNKTYAYIDYKGDTTLLPVYNNPTICDCYQANYHNVEQKKICALKYDYDFMSEEEQKAYDKALAICKHPDICDCKTADTTNRGLLKACNKKYFYKNISQKQLLKNIALIEKCESNKKADTLPICDCINTTDYKTQKKCEELYFNDSIEEKQRQINYNKLKKCIENKRYDLKVTTCDCAIIDSTDKELKKLCDDKIIQLKNNKQKLEDYYYTLNICKEKHVIRQYLERINLEDTKYTLCKCNEEELSKEEIKECNTIWDLSKMTEEEKKAFKNQIVKCKK